MQSTVIQAPTNNTYTGAIAHDQIKCYIFDEELDFVS